MYLSGTFAIILVLELAVFEYQAEAFTIQRPTELTNKDLDQAESVHLEVRNDLRRNVKPIGVKNDSPPLTAPIQTTAKTEEIQKNIEQPSNKTDVNTTSSNVVSNATSYMARTTTTTTVPDNMTTTVLTTSYVTNSSTTTDKPYFSATEMNIIAKSNFTLANKTRVLIEETTDKLPENMNENKTVSTKIANDNKHTSGNITSYSNNEVTVNGSNQLNVTNKINSTYPVNTTNPVISNNTSLVNITTRVPTVYNHTTIKEVEQKTEVKNTSYSPETVKINGTTSENKRNYTNDNSTTTTDESSTTTLSSDIKESKNITREGASDWKNEITDRSEKSTESLTGDYSGVTGMPYWKKYTTIDRKRVNITKDAVPSTEREEDLLQSGTVQTQTSISFEKALNINSDIPSLQQLKDELLSFNRISTTSESPETASSLETAELSSTIPGTVAESDISTTRSERTTQGFNIVSSKRAGFLDFSSRPTVATETITTQEIVNITEAPLNYTNPPIAKTSFQTTVGLSMASQSQLVDDAINEELRKEEILNDSAKNAQRLHEDRFGVKPKHTVVGVKPKSSQQIPQDTSAEDKLRVRPISAEKKNGTLYTVSPNYKPLKKIEVQPPKPFVRNPDDNNWRNESLSSLGIVFKANNSTKPFTQVLKNKTETELNGLLERYSKGDAPELRERLEKITEIRKSKKKKVNQFGETVYTDYEEATSGENSNSTNLKGFLYSRNNNVENNTFSMDEAEIGKLTTNRAYVFEDFETTTINSKKFLDEYEEEDESDYTLPNIDLQKYITPTVPAPKYSAASNGPITSPPIPLTVRTYPPDRQPTLQYFPPREKQQKVVINDYDVNFQKKINAYTYDAPNKIINPVTAAPPSAVTFNFPKSNFEQQSSSNDIAKRPEPINKNVYFSNPPFDQRTTNDFGNPNQGSAGNNQGSYVIKHLRDFIDAVVKADENPPAITEEPVRGVTANSLVHQKKPAIPSDYYDYEALFRKDVLNRFVENFNQNSERFKADFPVLYNTSVVHSLPGLAGGGAESTAFMKRLYEDVRVFQNPKDWPKRYDPHCDRTVELSPAYELHYYVPEEEEKEEVEFKPMTTPAQRLRL